MASELRRRLLRSVCGSSLFRWGVRLAESIPSGGRGNLLRVLTYHRVDDLDSRPDLDPTLISATPEQFARQVDWLSRDYDLVSLDDALEAHAGGGALPPRAVLLTFDDACQDFEQHAWPILRRRAAPATLFVPTAYPDAPERSFWWDQLYNALVRSEAERTLPTPFGAIRLGDAADRWNAFRRLKQQLKSLPESQRVSVVEEICERTEAARPAPAVLGWQSLRALAQQGVALVPHTHTHPLLNRLPAEEARDEIRRSRQILEAEVGPCPPAFAYPSGHYDESTAAIVREEGFQLAFTTVRGINDFRSCDPLRLRRSNVGRSTPDALIRFQLAAIVRHLNGRLRSRHPWGASRP